ncbi:hypothetical protein AVEN_231470-1 [Araneus ventricosus]|uniref:Uncharacterized protein n=1 Tax=Araneus ventricosus TaxID=182803 RepID=A0A4Y2VKZ5_ARAVE|nr:hypothetical protein AVEN_231470-1 [Araneus ventricosus]
MNTHNLFHFLIQSSSLIGSLPLPLHASQPHPPLLSQDHSRAPAKPLPPGSSGIFNVNDLQHHWLTPTTTKTFKRRLYLSPPTHTPDINEFRSYSVPV